MTGVASEQHDNWSELPGELLDAIMQRLTKSTEVIYFRAVCKPWRRPSLKFRQSLPWLRCNYIKGRSLDCTRENCRHFIDVTRRSNNMIRHVDIPQNLDAWRGCSSPLGWRIIPTGPGVFFDECFLLEPFTGETIPLPRITFDFEYIKVFAMSAEPMAEECIVMVHYSGGLAFCNLGVKRQQQQGYNWTLIPFTVEPIENTVFLKDRFHAICWNEEFLVCDLDGPHPMLSPSFLPKLSNQIWSDLREFSVVVSPEGDLMLVTSHAYDHHHHEDPPPEYTRRYSYHKTIAFTVYKINQDKQRWDEVECIGDYALFFNGCHAIYVYTKDHPECRKNCVYYDWAAYNISSKRLESFSSDDTLDNVYPMRYWIFPSS